MENCVDIVRPFIVEAANEKQIRIQILGGIGVAALLNSSTIYDSSASELIAPREGLFIPRQRENGSPRDMDILVLSTDKRSIEKIEKIADQTIGDRLEVNVFGLHQDTEIKNFQEHPFSMALVKAALSDRYVIGEELNG